MLIPLQLIEARIISFFPPIAMAMNLKKSFNLNFKQL